MSGQSLVKAFVPLPGQATAVYTSAGLDHYRHSDWLGSARLTSSPSRSYVSSTAYAPFGETYAQSGTQDLSFTGQNSDSSSGDYDFLYRQYSTQGRWASPDPAGLAAVNPANPQSWNRDSYVVNSPLASTDPLGLCAQIRDAYGNFRCIDTCPQCGSGGGTSCLVDGAITDCGVAFHQFFHDDPFAVLFAAGAVTGYTKDTSSDCLQENVCAPPIPIYGNLGLVALLNYLPGNTRNTSAITSGPRTPFYKTCTAKAIGNTLLHAGIDAIGLIPEGGPVSKAVGNLAGYRGIVATQQGTKAIQAGKTATGISNTGVNSGDTSTTGLISTGLGIAGFIPGLGQAAAAGSIGVDVYNGVRDAVKCY